MAESRKGSWLDARDDAIIMTLFATGARESEIMSLAMEGKENDVWFEVMLVNGVQTEVLVVFIEKSKTDRERHGHTVLITLPRIRESARSAP
jgi:site-specific recombinase XerD